MPLDSRATQTTATNSATYLVNSRRRVFTTGPSAGACCGVFAPAAPDRVEARKYLAKSKTLMASTVSNVDPPCPPSPQVVACSFDYLVGACKQHRWHIESHRLGRLQVDDQFELGRRLHGQTPGIGALQDSVDVGCGSAKDIDGIAAVG